MTIETCAHCTDRFVSSHETYHPKIKYSPETKIYCSDSCYQGIEPVRDIHGHDIRTMTFAESDKRDGWVCLKCMNVWKTEELIAKDNVEGT